MQKLICVGYVESLDDAVKRFPEMKHVTAVRIRDWFLTAFWKGDCPYFGPGFLAQYHPFSYLKRYEAFAGNTRFDDLPARWTYEMGIKPQDKDWSRLVWQVLGENSQLKKASDLFNERFQGIPFVNIQGPNEWIPKRKLGGDMMDYEVPVKLRYRNINCAGWI